MERSIEQNGREYFPLNPALLCDNNLFIDESKIGTLWDTSVPNSKSKLKGILYDLLVIDDISPSLPVNPLLNDPEISRTSHVYPIDVVRLLKTDVTYNLFPDRFNITNLTNRGFLPTTLEIIEWGSFYFDVPSLKCIYAPFVTKNFYKSAVLFTKMQAVLKIIEFYASFIGTPTYLKKVEEMYDKYLYLLQVLRPLLRNEFIFVADTERLFRSKTKYKALRKHLLGQELIHSHKENLHKVVFADFSTLGIYEDTLLDSFEEALNAEFRRFNTKFHKFKDEIFRINHSETKNYKSLILNELLPRKKNIIFPVERVLQGASISS